MSDQKDTNKSEDLKTLEAMADAREEYDEGVADKKDDNQRHNRTLQKNFIHLYCEGVGQCDYDSYLDFIKQIYLEAGYKISNKAHLAYKARQQVKRSWPQIQEGLAQQLHEGSAIAIRVLLDLATKAKQDSVKLKAATEILNKGGFAETQKIEITEKKPEELSESELQEEIKKAMDRRHLTIVPAVEAS